MAYDVTLIRFMILTAQDQDREDRDGLDLVEELSHWFSTDEVKAHRLLLYSVRILNDPDEPDAKGRKRLTRIGARLAGCLRDEESWRDAIPPHNPPTFETFRAIIAHALRSLRGRERTATASLRQALNESIAGV